MVTHTQCPFFGKHRSTTLKVPLQESDLFHVRMKTCYDDRMNNDKISFVMSKPNEEKKSVSLPSSTVSQQPTVPLLETEQNNDQQLIIA